MKKVMIALCMISVLALGAGSPAAADEITDQIKNGLEMYDAGHIGAAITEIDFALGQLRQKQSEAIASALPEQVEGWETKQTETGSQNMMGAGAAASRTYRQQDGKGNAKIEVMRLTQGLSAMFNPMMLQRMGGGKPVLVNGQKATLMARNQRQAELVFNPTSEFAVKIEITNLDDADKAAMDFAKKIDMKKLNEMLQ